MNILIPMAGAGSRFQEQGYKLPKPLIDVCGKPMIVHTYERALEATNPENIFIATDTEEIMRVCKKATVYDGRRVLDESKLVNSGWAYFGVGLPN